MVKYAYLNPESSDEEEEPEVISRVGWEARPPLRVRTFVDPPTSIVYSQTDTKECHSRSECTRVVQDIQSYHMDVRDMPDIQYHFLIGGDGNIYEGRGWDNIGQVDKYDHSIPRENRGKVIEVAFIGDYRETQPPKKMLQKASALIKYGIDNNKIIIMKRSQSVTNYGETNDILGNNHHIGTQGYREYGEENFEKLNSVAHKDEEKRK